MLELARQFVESHCKPKNTIIFATFDLEEMGGQVSHILLPVDNTSFSYILADGSQKKKNLLKLEKN